MKLPVFLSIFVSVSPLWAADAPPAANTASIPIAELKREKPVDFERDLLPIFKSSCLACHNQTKAKANLVLETPQTIAKGGDSGPTVAPGHGSESLLLKAASHQIEDVIMPPKNNKVAANDLTSEQLGLIKLWIDQGATGEVRAAGPIAWQPVPANLQPIYAVAISPDRQFIACGRANRIALYHLPSRQLITLLSDPALTNSSEENVAPPAHRDLVHALEFSPDGSLLASGGYREVKLWRYRPPESSLALALPQNVTATFAASGKFLEVQPQLVLRDPVSGQQLAQLDGAVGLPLCALSPDGKLFASATDNSLVVWDVAQRGSLVRTNLESAVKSLLWIPGTNQLVTGSADGLVRLWQLPIKAANPFELVKKIEGHKGAVNALALTPSPRHLVSGGEDGWVRITPLQKEGPVRTLNQEHAVTALAVRADGKRFAAITTNKVLKLWDQEANLVAEIKGNPGLDRIAASKARVQTLANAELDYQKGILKTAQDFLKKEEERVKKATEINTAAQKAFQEKEKALADAKNAQTAADKALADLESDVKKAADMLALAEKSAQHAEGEAKDLKSQTSPDPGVVEKKNAAVEALSKAAAEAKTAHEKVVADAKGKEGALKDKAKDTAKKVGDADKELKKAQLAQANGETELELAAKSLQQLSTQAAESTNAVATAEAAKTSAEASLQQARKVTAEAIKPINQLAFSPDNVYLVTAGEDGLVRIWSAETGQACAALPTPSAAISSLNFSNNTLLVAAAGSIVRGELNSRWSLERVIGSGDASSPIADRVNALAFSPDGATLASGGGDPSRSGEILLWEVASGKLARALKDIHSDTVLALEFSPDGKFLASSGSDRFLRVTSLASGKVFKSFEGHSHHVLGLSWKADGRTLATAGADNVVKIWDFTTGERKKNIEGFSKEVTSVRFLGVTDQLLASAGDSKVRLLRDNGTEVRTFAGATDFVYASAVSDDGKIAVAGGAEGVLKIWNVEDGKTLATFDPR